VAKLSKDRQHGKTPNTLDAALSYAERGWFVFPVPPGQKKSYLSAQYSNGRKWGATNRERLIRRTFRKYPQANIGIVTGELSGFFVVEADTKEGHNVDGIASLKKLQAKHGALTKTLQAISPSGSLHFYFRHPGVNIKNSASEIAPGVDVRGDGGMVLAPPSLKPSVGAYRWVNSLPVAAAPQWLLGLILKQPEPDQPSISERANVTIRKLHAGTDNSYAEAALRGECEAVASSTKGNRNDTLNRAAFSLGTLVGAGALAEDDAINVMLNAATACGLVRDDGKGSCMATIRSGLNAGVKQPRTIPEPNFRRHDVEWLCEVYAAAATRGRADA
jgi:hypothetical protein